MLLKLNNASLKLISVINIFVITMQLKLISRHPPETLEDLLVHLRSKHRATGLVEDSSSQTNKQTKTTYFEAA